MRMKGIILSCNIVKKIDSKYCAIAKFFDIESQRLHQLYFPKNNCNDKFILKLPELKNKKVEIEIELPYNLIVSRLNIIE